MLAEQPSRIEKARRALRILGRHARKVRAGARRHDRLRRRRAELAFPLTTDIGHLRHVAQRLADMPPPSVESEAKFESGTRIGAALKQAVAGLFGHVGGEIVLLSDGDDPIDDEEWQAGITAARTAGVPVHAVAVGEPGIDATIPSGADVLRYDDQVVKTRVQPERLDEIARRTGGLSLAAAKGNAGTRPAPRTTSGLATTSDRPRHRHDDPADAFADARPVPAGRSDRLAGELGAAAADVASRRLGRRSPPGVRRLAALIGAAPAVEDWLRRGNEAFGRRDFDEAIRCYRKALAQADDPGQVAFDLAAARFRKEEYAAAVTAYRQALDDGEIPLERRQRAWFDLGNALLAEAGTSDRRLVEEAMTAYRHCLAADPEPELQHDAEHNLALAGGRWLKTQPPPPDQGNDPGNTPDPNPKPETGDPKNPQSTNSTGDPTGDPKSTPGVGDPKGGDKKTPARGAITGWLPDSTERATA